jgi:hypothetical protein
MFGLAATLAFLGVCYGAGGWWGVVLGCVFLLWLMSRV